MCEVVKARARRVRQLSTKIFGFLWTSYPASRAALAETRRGRGTNAQHEFCDKLLRNVADPMRARSTRMMGSADSCLFRVQPRT